MIIRSGALHRVMPGDDNLHEWMMDAYSDLMNALRKSHKEARTEGEFWGALEYNFGPSITAAYLEHLQLAPE